MRVFPLALVALLFSTACCSLEWDSEQGTAINLIDVDEREEELSEEERIEHERRLIYERECHRSDAMCVAGCKDVPCRKQCKRYLRFCMEGKLP